MLSHLRIAGLVILVLMVALLGVQTYRLDKASDALSTERANHQATVTAYRDAQAEAERLQTARNADAVARQERVNANVSQDYERRLADLRSRYAASLRNRASTTVEGATSTDGLSSVTDATSGADGATVNELPARLTDDERLEAAEIALRLSALQDWVTQQTAAQ